MKNLLPTLATAALAAAILCGCGKKNDTPVLRIGVSIPSADHGWTGGIVWMAEQGKKAVEADHPNFRVLLSTARDAAEQVDKIENLLVQKIDALVVLPHEPGPLTGICEKAAKQGVKLIVVDRGLDRPVEDLFVAGDNPEFGRTAAQALAKALDGKGDIVIMEGIPCVVNTDRVNAFRDVIKGYPGIRILDSQSAYWDPEKGLKLMENFLLKHPRIDAVWAGDDDVLTGALKAYEESGRSDIRLFIGGGGSKAIVKRILDKDPVVPLTVTYPPRMIRVAIDQARALLDNTAQIPADKKLIVHAEIIDATNAADHYFPDSAY